MNDIQSSDDEPTPDGGKRYYTLVYCSRAREGLVDSDIARILDSARPRNAALGVTGVLVHGAGVFFQMLEGPRGNVRGLMDLIGSDPRHSSIIELSEIDDVPERLFPTWDMRLATVDDIREVLLDARGEVATASQIEALEGMLSRLEAGADEGR